MAATKTATKTTPKLAPPPAERTIQVTRRVQVQRAPDGESRRARFIRLANLRAVNAIHAVRLIGNLAGPQYEWTEQDAGRIMAAVQTVLDDVGEKFRTAPQAEKPENKFRLSLVPDTEKAA